MNTVASPTFSVIIPNYNNGDTLARAIDSVLSQSCPAHEIIIIDDGSTDNSNEIASGYGNKIKYIYQKNAGVSCARNHGAIVASGNWLAFLDADDCYLPDRLESHALWIMKQPDLNFLLGNQEYRSPDGELLYLAMENCLAGQRLIARNPDKNTIPVQQSDFEDLIADGFGEIRTLSVPRKDFLALGGFAEGIAIGEDLHFFIRLCAASSQAGVIRAPLAIYYIYSNSTLRKDVIQSQIRFVQTLESLNDVLGFAQENIKRGQQRKIRSARLNLAYAWLRKNKKWQAVKSILPSLMRHPGPGTLRDVLSVIRGFHE